jgi:putative peptidoglycan lipid II flippase
MAGTLLAFSTGEPTFLAWGFTSAYVFLAIWARVRLRNIGATKSIDPEPGYGHVAALGELWRAIRPLLIVPIVLQGSIAVERAVASLISQDAVAAVDYARLVTETSLALVGAPIGLAVLANHSTLHLDETRSHVVTVINRVLLIFLPISVFLALGAEPTVQILFQRGAFDAESVNTTASILTGLSIALWAQVCAYIMIKALSSHSRNHAAAVTVVAGGCVTIVVDLALYRSAGALALGLGASAGFLVQVSISSVLLGVGSSLSRTLARHIPAVALALSIGAFAARLDHSGAAVQFVLTALACCAGYLAGVLLVPTLRKDGLQLLASLRRSS